MKRSGRWKKKAELGDITLYYADESGFAPTLPVTYAWSKRGERKIAPYEAPKRRRVNVIGALCKGVDFVFKAVSGKLTAEVFVEFLEGLPRPVPDRPVYVVVDNYSIHKARRIRDRLDALAATGLHLFFLPPYSPELNDIEPCWRYIKHQGMEVRLFQSQTALHEGVERGLNKYRDRVAAGRTIKARSA